MPPTTSPRRPLTTRARLHAPRLTAIALLLAGLGATQAQTWTGGGTSNGWMDNFNWQGFVRPSSSATTAITFDGGVRLSPVQNLLPTFTVNSITFAPNAGAFALSGNVLRFAGNNARLVQNSANAVSIANGIQLATSVAIDGPGDLTLTGILGRQADIDRSSVILTKRGTGTLTLTGVSVFDSVLRVTGGRVLVRNDLALANATVQLDIGNGLSFGSLAQATLGGLTGSGALTLGATALTVGNADSPALYSGALTGTGTVTKAGSGTARWSGTSQVDTLQVRAGQLQLEGGALTLTNAEEGLFVGSGSAASGSAATLALSSGATASATGRTVQVDGRAGTTLSIAGTGSRLTTGFQTLVGNHASGRADVGSGGTLAAGTFLLVGWDDGGQGTLAVNAGGTVTSIAGVVGGLAGGTGLADVNGAGALWSTNSLGIGGFDDSLRGGTGTLTVRDGGRVTVRDTLSFRTANGTVTVNGGTLRAGNLSSAAGVGSITLQADPAGGAALVLDGAADASFAGVLSGAGSLLKTGTGAQTLAGASTGFTGVTTIQGGRIVVGHQDALRRSQVRIDVDNGLNLGGLAGVAVGSLAGNGALALGTTELTLGEDDRNASYGGVLGGADATLTKKGTGTQTLTGGGSTLNRLVVEGGGTVALNAGGSLSLKSPSNGLAALTLNSGGRVEVLGGGVLSLTGGGTSSTFLSGDGTTEVVVDGSGSQFLGGVQTVAALGGQGRITLRNGGRFSGQFALVAGFADGSDGTVSLASGAQATDQQVLAGVLPGATGRLLVSGAGTRLTATGQLGLGGFSLAQSGGTGSLDISDGASVTTPQLRLWTAGSSVRIDGASLDAGELIGTAGGRITLVADPAVGRALTVGRPDGSHSYNGDIDGDGGLRKVGASSQVLSGRNSFTGLMQVQGGTLTMASSGAAEYEVGSGATLRLGERNLGAAVVQALPGGQVVYTNTNLNGGLLIGPGGHDISAVRRMVGTRVTGGTLLTPAAGTTFVGVVNEGSIDLLPGRSLTWTSGSNPGGRVTVAGSASVSHFRSGGELVVPLGGTLVSTAGNLVLGGGSRTTVGAVNAPGGTVELRAGGRLQVNGGLLVNNGTIQGPVEVNFGSLAKGAGTYGQVIVNDGGRFSPGNSPGVVSTAGAVWGMGGNYLVELASATGTAGVDWDLWRVQGALSVQSGTTANSRFTISLATLDANDQPAALASFDAHRAWQWRIVDTDGGILGFDPARVALDTQGFASPLAGGTLQLSVQDGDLYLVFAPVPEPQTWALLLGGLGVLGWAARRRRAASA